MKLNQKGITLFELLATISVGGIVLALMTSIMFSTLFTKNQIEYINRLDDEIYDITSFLSGRFQNMGYGSILLYEGENLNEYQTVIIISTEFTPISDEQIALSRRSFVTKILLIDTDPDENRNGIYFHTLFRVDEDDPLSFEDQIDAFLDNLDAEITAYLNPVARRRPEGIISSDNLIIHDANVRDISVAEGTCIKRYDLDDLSSRFSNINRLVSSCSNAFVEMSLSVSYRLRSGEALDPRSYNSTLFF